jgi:hypothetical protein
MDPPAQPVTGRPATYGRRRVTNIQGTRHQADVDAYEAIRRGAQEAGILPDGFLIKHASVVFEAVGDDGAGNPVTIRGRYHPISIGLGSERGILQTATDDVVHELDELRARTATA